MCRTAVLLILLIAAACSDDARSELDAGVDAVPGACTADAALHARFVIAGEPGATGPMGNQAGGSYQSWPDPQLMATLAEAGGCRFLGPRPALCEPICTGDELCDVNAACVRYPDRLAAGTLRVAGTTPPLAIEPNVNNWYSPGATYPQLYRPGDPLVVELDGAAGVAALHAEVRGVPTLAMPTTQLTAVEHQDMEIVWTAVAQPAGAEVVVHFDSDHHGTAAAIECIAPAAAGSLTIPAAIIDRIILAGETGIGTYIENAWIELRHRALVATERGCAAVDAYSAGFVSVETVRAR